LTPDDPTGLIPEDDFVAIMDQLKPIIAADFPDTTWFEVLTAVAFQHFSNQKVDVAVIEVGLGGRLDATNVLTPLVSVITSLSLDHTEFLGNTLAEIAYEKGGIIKPSVPVVVAPQPDEAVEKLKEIGLERESPISFIQEKWDYTSVLPKDKGDLPQISIQQAPAAALIGANHFLPLNLLGEHQIENGIVALATLSQVTQAFPQLDETAVRRGFTEVTWNGRLQILHQGDALTPTLLLDCAHNPDSATKLKEALESLFDYDRLLLVFGAPADKDVEGMLRVLLPISQKNFFTTASHPRSITPEALVEMSQKLGFDGSAYQEILEAIETAVSEAKANDLICVTGSIIVVGDLLIHQERLQSLLKTATIQDQ
jgi:dihydrofolate synthase/folylpolyglutamate synthase